MQTKQKQLKESKPIEDLAQEFHNRARDIANELNRHLLTLSTGIVAAFFYFAVDKRADLKYLEKILILITIALFGLAILYSILGMKWDASKNFFLGEINDPAEQENSAENEKLKENYDDKQLKAKRFTRKFFLLGILGAFIFLAKFILIP